MKKDCLDLPEKVYIRREIQMTPEQSKAYKELQNFAATQLKNNKLVTKIKFTEIIKIKLKKHLALFVPTHPM